MTLSSNKPRRNDSIGQKSGSGEAKRIAQRMIRKSVQRFSEKIMRKQ